MRPPVEAGLKTDEVVIKAQLIRGRNRCVQDNFTISRITRRHDRTVVNRHRKIWGEPIVGTPFVDGPNEVRLGRGVCHHKFTGA
jgi:hypothetical protein